MDFTQICQTTMGKQRMTSQQHYAYAWFQLSWLMILCTEPWQVNSVLLTTWWFHCLLPSSTFTISSDRAVNSHTEGIFLKWERILFRNRNQACTHTLQLWRFCIKEVGHDTQHLAVTHGKWVHKCNTQHHHVRMLFFPFQTELSMTLYIKAVAWWEQSVGGITYFLIHQTASSCNVLQTPVISSYKMHK